MHQKFEDRITGQCSCGAWFQRRVLVVSDAYPDGLRFWFWCKKCDEIKKRRKK